MADNHAHPVSHPALDDAEHKTCPLFLQLTKYTVASAGLNLALLALYYG